LSRPEVAFPSAHPDEAEAVEIDVAALATLDVPEEDRLAEAVVRWLRERAGTGDSTAAVVEPVPRDVPLRYLSHARCPPGFSSAKSLVDVELATFLHPCRQSIDVAVGESILETEIPVFDAAQFVAARPRAPGTTPPPVRAFPR